MGIELCEQIKASRMILEASQNFKQPYWVSVCGHRFIVNPGVFSPRYFGSTDIFSRHFPYRGGERFLEVGCGTGITSVIAAFHGAQKVVALDINPKAVENTQRNASLHALDRIIDARVSDVFSALSTSEHFETIYWNLPFIYVAPRYKYRSVLERALYDPGYSYTRRFLSQAPRFLSREGRVVLGFGDFGDLQELLQLVDEFKYKMREIASEPSREGMPVNFILYELWQASETQQQSRRRKGRSLVLGLAPTMPPDLGDGQLF
jgi:release factor glutamine methyltransferase